MSFSSLYFPFTYNKSGSFGGVNLIIAPPGVFSIEFTTTFPGAIESPPCAL